MRRLALAACGVLLAGIAVASADSPEELFAQANAAYEQGRYAAAAEGYREVLGQVRSAIVEFNLGNAEFRLGRLGQAVLHFERARRLDPVDPEIQANLALARSLCADRVEVAPSGPLERALRLAQERIGPDLQAWAALAVLWLVGGLLAWCFGRPGGFRARHGWMLAGLLLALAVCAGSWRLTLGGLEGARAAVVLESTAEVLAGPGASNAVLFNVHEGLLLEVRGEGDGWLQVSLPNGLNGWIARKAVGEV